MINFSLLKDITSGTLYPNCSSQLEVTDDLHLRMGFSHQLTIHCPNCDWNKRTFTSPQVARKECKEKQERKIFDVNIRSVIGLREVGCGYATMKSFSRCMNINCLSENGFNSVNNDVMNAYRKAVALSMKKTAMEMCVEDVTEPRCVRVTVDGSWQKRGHNSLNGVVTAISGGKCVDVEGSIKAL